MQRYTKKDLQRILGKKTVRSKPVPHEEISCKTLCDNLLLLSKNRTLFKFSHIPMGGMRHKKVAGDMRAMGALAGIWDYWFAKPGLPTHWLEMKHGSNSLTPEQEEFGVFVRECGNTTDVCWSVEEALESLSKRGFFPREVFSINRNLIIIKQDNLAPNHTKNL